MSTHARYGRWMVAGLAFCLGATTSGAGASELVYHSNNPSFGGSPFLDSFLLTLADIQNEHKARQGGGSGGVPSINFPPITIDLGGAGQVASPPNGGTLPDGTSPPGITPTQ